MPWGIGVIAETPWAGFAARNEIDRTVTWSKDGKAWGFDSEKGLEAFARTALDPDAKATDWFKLGDVRTEMPKAASTFEAAYLCDYAYHAQMEPLNGVASVSPAGDSAEIWCGTQSQTMAVEATAKALGIERDKVKLHDTLIGGGFGGKHSGECAIEAARMILDRGARDVYMFVTHAAMTDEAVDLIHHSPLHRLVVTNTIPLPQAERSDKIEVLTVAPLLAEAIKRIHEGESVSALFT